MTQKLVYDLLKEMGGQAQLKDLHEFACQKYPNDFARSKYGKFSVGNRLLRMQKWGIVDTNRKGLWTIKKDWF